MRTILDITRIKVAAGLYSKFVPSLERQGDRCAMGKILPATPPDLATITSYLASYHTLLITQSNR